MLTKLKFKGETFQRFTGFTFTVLKMIRILGATAKVLVDWSV